MLLCLGFFFPHEFSLCYNISAHYLTHALLQSKSQRQDIFAHQSQHLEQVTKSLAGQMNECLRYEQLVPLCPWHTLTDKEAELSSLRMLTKFRMEDRSCGGILTPDPWSFATLPHQYPPWSHSTMPLLAVQSPSEELRKEYPRHRPEPVLPTYCRVLVLE